MKKTFSSFIIFVTLSSIYYPQNKMNDLATIGTEKIGLAEFEDRYSSYLSSSGIKDNIEVRKAILNNIINEILLKNFDDNDNITNNTEFQKEILWSKKQTTLAYLKDQQIYAKLSVTDEELKEAFFRLNKQIAARHIFADNEETANFYHSLLKTGISFETLAKQVFTDTTLKDNGGFLGYFTWGDMDPNFEDAAFSLKIGEISTPIKTAQGYSIIRVDDIIQNPIITESQFLQKKNQLERLIKIKKKTPAEKEYVSNLVDIKEVKFDDDALQNILVAFSDLDNIEKKQTISSQSNCADYKGIHFKSSFILQKLNELPGNVLQRINSVENLKAAITGIIIQDKLLEVAYDLNYDKNELVVDRINKLNDNIFFKYKKKEILDKTDVTDDELLKYYKENIHLFTKEREINVQEILVNDKSLADSLFNELESGKNFDEMALKFSIREWSAKNKGVLGYAPASRFGMLKDRFLNEPIGNLIGPIQIESLFGIFKVLGKNDEQPLEFNLVKNYAKNLLKEEKSKVILQEYLDKLKSKVNVKINEELLLGNNISG